VLNTNFSSISAVTLRCDFPILIVTDYIWSVTTISQSVSKSWLYLPVQLQITSPLVSSNCHYNRITLNDSDSLDKDDLFCW